MAELLNGKHVVISFVTELELLGYKELSESDLEIIQELVKEATVTDINAEIKRLVIFLRKNYKIKLPDALVVASALYSSLPLVTADKQLSQVSELVDAAIVQKISPTPKGTYIMLWLCLA